MKPEKLLRFLFLVLVATVIYVAYASGWHQDFAQTEHKPAVVQTAAVDGDLCDDKPPRSGRVFLIENNPALMKSRASAHIDVENKHHFPVVLMLTSPDGNKEYMGVYLASGQKAKLSAVPGNYGLLALAGRNWCNLETGFIDGAEQYYAKEISLSERTVAGLTLLPLGRAPSEIMFSYSAGGLDKASSHATSLTLHRMTNGHFYVNGRVEGHPLTFIVDTGASSVTIPYSLATRIGLDKECRPARFTTAAGVVQGCTAVVKDMSVGGFSLRQIEVGFNKGGETPLLGMNVLSQFRIQQNAEIMLISMN